jgi:hypothetical protein
MDKYFNCPSISQLKTCMKKQQAVSIWIFLTKMDKYFNYPFSDRIGWQAQYAKTIQKREIGCPR